MRSQIQLLTAAGLAIDWREFPKVHTIDDEQEFPVIREFVKQCLEADVPPGTASMSGQSVL
jgi:hypothetical protein